MVTLWKNGAYLLNGKELIEDDKDSAAKLQAKLGACPDKKEAAKNTMAYGIT